jgi:proteasome activator subunit 4
MEKFNSPAIQWIVPTAIVDMGVTIASGAGVSLSENELSDGAAHLKERNKQTDQMYENLVAQLMSLAESDKLHWRFTEFAVHFLVPLIRHDRLLPTAAVGFFVHSLNHETLAVRKMAIAAVMAILKQQKRPHVTVSINPYQLAGVNGGSNVTKVHPGDRLDNMWHRYDVKSLPQTEEQWNSTVFIDKTFWGFYCWPREMTAYAPYDQQPSVERTRDQLTESEAVIYDAFSSTEFVDKLIGFLSMEERKGRDKYNWNRFVMFKVQYCTVLLHLGRTCQQ